MKKWNIGWGVISNCNMNCEFCYSKQKREAGFDLNFSDWAAFVDDNSQYISSINYGTGENALSNDWFRFIAYVRERYPEIRQAVTTNGYVYQAVKNDELKKRIFLNSIDEVDVSLDFSIPERHNAFRGQPKAFEWAINTIKFCCQNSIRLTIVTLGSSMTLNDENVSGIFKIAKSYDAILRVNIYRPTMGINEFTKKFIVSIDQLLSFLKFVNENYKILAINDPLISSLLTAKTVSDPSGINSLRILPNGDVTPSTYLITDSFVVGNITQRIILPELEAQGKLSSFVNITIPKECYSCELVSKCKGGVIDRRYLWYGSLDRKDPYCFVNKAVDFKIHISSDRFESVHDGYLPTMFFKN